MMLVGMMFYGQLCTSSRCLSHDEKFNSWEADSSLRVPFSVTCSVTFALGARLVRFDALQLHPHRHFSPSPHLQTLSHPVYVNLPTYQCVLSLLVHLIHEVQTRFTLSDASPSYVGFLLHFLHQLSIKKKSRCFHRF